MQRLGLPAMSEDDGVADLKPPDHVPAVSLRRHGMEKAGVLVALADGTKLTPLLPKGRLRPHGELKGCPSIGSEGGFVT
jgi:hypothetical protein